MKKTFLLAILLSSTFSSLFAEDKLFAILDDSVHIVYDTVKFKSDVLEIAFGDYKQKPLLASLKVLKKSVVGGPNKFYYSVLVSDSSGEIKVAKWLEKRGNSLYLINRFTKDNRLKAYYFTCIGEAGCTPSILSVNGELGWSCSESAVCTSDTSCRTIKSLVVD